MTAPTIQDTLNELHELSAFFVEAEETIKNGGTVDMAGIDARIETVCKTVQSAVPAQQQQYLPELTALLTLLDSCEMAIRSMGSAADASSQSAKG